MDLKYIYENKSNVLPERIKYAISSLVSQGFNEKPSLMVVHKSLYAPLLKCETLKFAKLIYKEFENILPGVELQENSLYALRHVTTAEEKLALKLLQEHWAKLHTKDEIAKELGIERQKLDNILEEIHFVEISEDYRDLLNVSNVK